MSSVGDGEALQCFERTKPRLAGLDESKLEPPSADPHSAAVTALLIADFLSQGATKEKLSAAKKGAASLSKESVAERVTELSTLARALLHCLTELGGDWFPLEGKAPPIGNLREEGAELRKSLVSLLEANVKDEDVRAIIVSIKKGEGDVDLVLDLRALALLVDAHAKDATGAKDALDRARALAAKVETKLAENDPPTHAEWRKNVVRVWSLFAPVYESLCKAGRELEGDRIDSAKFPPLFTVSRARRTRKRASIAPPPDADPVSLRHPPKAASIPPQSLDAARRVAPRFAVEMEVGIASESNFYVGFTENLSASGVFVATYSPKPIGAHVEVTLTLPNGAEIKALGTVRWIRGETQSGEAWPGMGVAFDKLTADQEDKIQKFIRFRDPLFFDDE